LRANADLLAVVESLDSGKSLAEAQGDVAGSARLFEYYAGAADKLDGRSVNLGGDSAAFTVREPVGVTAHIVPWNYPTSTLVRGLHRHLAAGWFGGHQTCGNNAVHRIADRPLAGRGWPARWCCQRRDRHRLGSGAPLVADPRVRHVTFTGSVATGVNVMRTSPRTLPGLLWNWAVSRR